MTALHPRVYALSVGPLGETGATRPTEPTENGDRMLLFIVSRESSKRFEYLARVFAKEETVQVILDRRVTERRARQTSGDGSQRRRGNRRETCCGNRCSRTAPRPPNGPPGSRKCRSSRPARPAMRAIAPAFFARCRKAMVPLRLPRRGWLIRRKPTGRQSEETK